MAKDKWWSEGVRFQCQGSGQCCLSRGQYGFVYLTLADRQRFARHFRLTTTQFTRRHCAKTNGYFHLKEEPGAIACRFLKDNRCGVYQARPTQCRTWPFWPEVMGAKSWAREVAAFCPGVGKGPVHPAHEIASAIDAQKRSEKAL